MTRSGRSDPEGAEERPGAEQWVPARPTLGALRDALPACRGCELYAPATQAVMGEGAAHADLMLVGEQPGDREDREGRPFVGPAGGVLERALADAGIDPGRVYTTNVVKHFRFTTRGKRRIHESPGREHVVACLPWLEAELTVVRPDGVVLLGGTAGKALYGSGFKVGERRGVLDSWPRESEAAPAWVLATTHPSAVLRAREARGATYDGLVADLRVAASSLTGP
ncbi:UdgX family uracil-DNA binding protein [Nocardioides sp. CER19]|uniref:UdgX family uracil-DNA binding protein n=1 Tax=Nocardioides sp. CER19 TaxID=3038538 RepID=UPI002449F7A8|nr:UdgX family uracil-DNA binding protein [Nocardioides sp. CER19]MDH2413621.1 UdgX family uracil-DNA binding protein [Nocardioides sp. CER19]